MKKLYRYLLVLGILQILLVNNKLFAQDTLSNSYKLTHVFKWKLQAISVNDYWVYDSIPSVLCEFKTNGNMEVSADSSFITTWQFTDTSQTQLVVNQGTLNEDTFTIEYIDSEMLLYKVDYTIEGTLYHYRFMFVKNEEEG